MVFVGFLVVGIVVGVLARLVVPGRQAIGAVLTVLLGIVGAVVGGLIAAAAGLGSVLQFLVSVAVAALLVYLIGGGRRQGTGRY